MRLSQKLDGRIGELAGQAKARGVPVDTSLGKGKDDAIAFILPFVYHDLKDFIGRSATEAHSLVVALDHLQDSQNLGALARSAEGLGAQALLLPKDRSVGVNGGAYHTSVGAIETLPIIATVNLGDGLRKLKEAGYWIVGSTLDEDAGAPELVPSFEKMVLVLGSELEGIAPGLLKSCDWKVKIPTSGRIQSLNVAAAGAILIYELLKRQKGTS